MDKKVNVVVNMLEKAVVRDIIVYDMRNFTPFYDYAVICSANTARQASAAINYVRKDTNEFDLNVKGYHSNGDSKWHLVDLGDIVVHVFVGDEREKYNLDGMYSMKDMIIE